LVSLQNFSRQLEKSKSQEEEIAGEAVLDISESELNRRSMEMEARLEQLQQMEDDFKQLEAQRQKIETGKRGAAAENRN